MNKHDIGFAHTFEIVCKNINLDIAGDGSQPIRVDLRRLALIPGNHETLYKDCMKAHAVPGKLLAYTSKTSWYSLQKPGIG